MRCGRWRRPTTQRRPKRRSPDRYAWGFTAAKCCRLAPNCSAAAVESASRRLAAAAAPGSAAVVLDRRWPSEQPRHYVCSAASSFRRRFALASTAGAARRHAGGTQAARPSRAIVPASRSCARVLAPLAAAPGPRLLRACRPHSASLRSLRTRFALVTPPAAGTRGPAPRAWLVASLLARPAAAPCCGSAAEDNSNRNSKGRQPGTKIVHLSGPWIIHPSQTSTVGETTYWSLSLMATRTLSHTHSYTTPGSDTADCYLPNSRKRNTKIIPTDSESKSGQPTQSCRGSHRSKGRLRRGCAMRADGTHP